MKKKLMVLMLVATILSVGLLGCDGNATGEKKDTLVAMSVYAGFTLDPTSGGLMDHMVKAALYDTLCRVAPDGTMAPLLAESWEYVDDNAAIVFHLNKEAKFHDGSPVTAEDVVYSIDVKLEKPQYSNMAKTIGAHEALDEYTVKVARPTPYADTVSMLAGHIYVLPKAIHQADPEAFAKNPVGSGPYVFVSQSVDETVTLKAFEDYYDKKSAFENVIIKPHVDPSTAIVALENGEVDFLPSVPAAQAKILKGNKKIVHAEGLSTRSNLLVMMGKTLNEDINLRKAIYYGIDREGVIAIANEGVGEVPKDIFAPLSMREFQGVVQVDGYDLEKAKEYMDKSSYSGQELVITTAADAAIAPAVQADLNELGLNVRIEQVDQSTWITRLRNGELEMTIVPFGELRSMGENLEFFEFSGRYYGLFTERNAEFEGLMAQVYEEYDPDKNEELSIQALQAFYDHTVVVNLYNETSNYSYLKDIEYNYPISAGLQKYYLNYVEHK